MRDVDDRSGRAYQTDGQETENLSDFTGLLRSGDCRSVDESGFGSVGADSNLFHQGAAKESDDPDVIAAAMERPGVVLRRAVGSDAPFGEHAELPTDLGGSGSKKAARKSKGPGTKRPSSRPVDKTAEKKAALAFEKEQKQRQLEQAKEETARQRERERRQQAFDKAQAVLDKAEREHAKRAAAIEAEVEALAKRSQTEEARWEKEKERLEAALRRARG